LSKAVSPETPKKETGMEKIACKTPGCTGAEFSAHQVVRIDIVVNGENDFQRNAGNTAEASIYDSGHPYGPYTCMACGTVAAE